MVFLYGVHCTVWCVCGTGLRRRCCWPGEEGAASLGVEAVGGLYTVYRILYTVYRIPYEVHSILYITYYTVKYTVYCILYNSLCIMYSIYCTLKSAHRTLESVHIVLYYQHFTLIVQIIKQRTLNCIMRRLQHGLVHCILIFFTAQCSTILYRYYDERRDVQCNIAWAQRSSQGQSLRVLLVSRLMS